MLQKADSKIDGVAAANDGLGAAVAAAQGSASTEKVPTTGQDATLEGLQHMVLGAQCMTVYKAIKKEADAASELAIALAKGEEAAADRATAGRERRLQAGHVGPARAAGRQQGEHQVRRGRRLRARKEDICATAALRRRARSTGVE